MGFVEGAIPEPFRVQGGQDPAQLQAARSRRPSVAAEAEPQGATWSVAHDVGRLTKPADSLEQRLTAEGGRIRAR